MGKVNWNDEQVSSTAQVKGADSYQPHFHYKYDDDLWRTLIGVIPIFTMAQSAAYWRNIHAHVDRTHSLTLTSTQLQPRGVKRQLCYY